jgi:hypothetical protein
MYAALRDHGFDVSDESHGRTIILGGRRGDTALEVFVQSTMGIGPAYWRESILTPGRIGSAASRSVRMGTSRSSI